MLDASPLGAGIYPISAARESQMASSKLPEDDKVSSVLCFISALLLDVYSDPRATDSSTGRSTVIGESSSIGLCRGSDSLQCLVERLRRCAAASILL